jgi:predicted ABC-type ATPase
MRKTVSKPSSGRKSPEGGVAALAAVKTQKSKSKKRDDSTPTSPELKEMIDTLEMQHTTSDGSIKPWFQTAFLQDALYHRLIPIHPYTPNPNPIFYVLVGPASSGKSSVKSQIPHFRETMSNAINLDVDEIKLYGNDTLSEKVNKEGKTVKVVEGIQFNYNEVLAKTRKMVFSAAIAGGKGQYKNIILDSTGSMKGVIKKYMMDAKKHGYTVIVIIVHSTKELCMTRVEGRNRHLTSQGHATRVISPHTINSIYDKFVKTQTAKYFATDPSVLSKTDEIYCIDNNGASPIILAQKTVDSGRIVVSRESSMVDVPNAFYGLTISSKGEIQGGNRKRQKTYKNIRNRVGVHTRRKGCASLIRI